MINSTVSNNSANCVNGWIIWGSGTLINSTISDTRSGADVFEFQLSRVRRGQRRVPG